LKLELYPRAELGSERYQAALKWLASPRPRYQTKEFMSDPLPLKLEALTWESDRSWIPPLEQVIIFTKTLGYICDREPQQLPDRPFSWSTCPALEPEEVDEWITPEGNDILGPSHAGEPKRKDGEF
jgi:hypothetical protein